MAKKKAGSHPAKSLEALNDVELGAKHTPTALTPSTIGRWLTACRAVRHQIKSIVPPHMLNLMDAVIAEMEEVEI
jgi:hypothetical protein